MQNKKINCLPFHEARQYVRSLGLKTWSEYIEFCQTDKRPKNIPVHPERKYKKTGWINMYDFIGTTEEESKIYLKNKKIFIWKPYNEAEKFAQSLNFKSNQEWRVFAKSLSRPNDIPSTPDKAYKNKGWISWGNWLGTNNVFSKEFLSFEESHKIILSFKLNIEDNLWDGWNKFCVSGNKPECIPANPDKIYKNSGWISMLHWITGQLETDFISFEDARNYVWTLNIKNQKAWGEYCKNDKKPDYIPATPNTVYKDKGWISFPDWLGTRKGFTGRYITFSELNKFVKTLKLSNKEEWEEWYEMNKPNEIPKTPYETYKTEWISWGDFLGTGRIADHLKEFVTLSELKKFASDNNIKTFGQWKKFWTINKRPDNIPSSPDSVYKDNGWISWPNFFNTEIGEYLSYEEAEKIIHSKKIKSKNEWEIFSKSNERPVNIPVVPNTVYKNRGWESWGKWLGTGTIAPQNMVFLPFEEAKEFIRKLNLKSVDAWREYVNSGKKPANIPANPQEYYGKSR